MSQIKRNYLYPREVYFIGNTSVYSRSAGLPFHQMFQCVLLLEEAGIAWSNAYLGADGCFHSFLLGDLETGPVM